MRGIDRDHRPREGVAAAYTGGPACEAAHGDGVPQGLRLWLPPRDFLRTGSFERVLAEAPTAA